MKDNINSVAEGLALYLASLIGVYPAAANGDYAGLFDPVSEMPAVAEADELPRLFGRDERPFEIEGLEDLRGFFRGLSAQREPAKAIEDAAASLDTLLRARGVTREEIARLKLIVMRAMEEYLDIILGRGQPPARPVESELEKSGVITADEKVIELFRRAARVASTSATVLIAGETGTGKELLAGHIHRLSPRAGEKLVEVNCAAIPQTLIESELFGHEKGAFTGATRRRRGRFLAANNGTLLMDEVSELDPAAQVKLLRVLQEGTLTPVGSDREIHCDVRIIALTSQDLFRMTNEGAFRPELYYRLKVVLFNLPPLRERGGDIHILADHFLEKYSREYSRKGLRFSGDALSALASYHFPGNVRELENIVRAAVALAEGSTITLNHLPAEITEAAAGSRDLLSRIRAASVDGEPVSRKLLKVPDLLLAKVLSNTRGSWFSRKGFREHLHSAGSPVSDRTAGTYLKLLDAAGILEWNGERTVRARYRLKT